jgi:hypothetical protein
MPKTQAPPALTTDWSRVLAMRIRRQHLAERTTPDRLVPLVGEMVGLHAQVASAAELQANARIDGLRPDDVRDALATRRSIVKAWSFRGTLHYLNAGRPRGLRGRFGHARALARGRLAALCRDDRAPGGGDDPGHRRHA